MKIGTCIRGQHLLADLENAIAIGFDTVELYFNETLGGINFKELSAQIKDVTGYSGVTVSGIGLYCNPLQSTQAEKELEYCIENAHLLDVDFVGTFAGALPGKSVEEAVPVFKKVFTRLSKLAGYNGVWVHSTCHCRQQINKQHTC